MLFSTNAAFVGRHHDFKPSHQCRVRLGGQQSFDIVSLGERNRPDVFGASIVGGKLVRQRQKLRPPVPHQLRQICGRQRDHAPIAVRTRQVGAQLQRHLRGGRPVRADQNKRRSRPR
ncbi:hypothetical protein [Burkholderia sp. MSMB1835]|uniref:hypothetical protein n=1 Tax=Burkholderia sp. MSMB1835 TaxID=1637876 RepID=UPI0012E38FFD|nr:hypothetical protein [Burkholderia sp. MSMB1835]